jgi:hypothetical protein
MQRCITVSIKRSELHVRGGGWWNALDRLSLLDLVLCAVTDEHRLASPFDDDILALGDGREVDFDLRLGEHIGGGGHIH